VDKPKFNIDDFMCSHLRCKVKSIVNGEVILHLAAFQSLLYAIVTINKMTEVGVQILSPRFRPFLIISLLAVSGCSVADIGKDLQLSLAEEQAKNVALPDAVAIVPDSPLRTGETTTYEPVVASSVSAYAQADRENPATAAIAPRKIAARSPELDSLIARYAEHHEIPVELLRRVVKRESTFNPAARNGPYWGLMQILPATARSMGYQGKPEGLLDAETNLKYAGKYLRGAYLVADGNHDQAVRLYARGYYYDAKRKGLLEETGLRPARKRMPNTVQAKAN
jgi:hypothetical protein